MLSSPGDVEWVRQFGANWFAHDGQDPAWALVADADGNVYVAGDIPVDAAEPRFFQDFGQAYVRKYDAAGNLLWSRQFGAAGFDSARGIAMDATGVYVAGFTNGALLFLPRTGDSDAFVRKYDFDGNELWTRGFGTDSDDQAAGIAVDATGVYVAGFTDGALPGESSAGGRDAFVRKYDAGGDVQWTRQFGTAGADQANGITLDATGVYVAGFTDGALPGQTSAGGRDAFVRKYDAGATVLSTHQFGTTGADQVVGIAVDATGIYVAGSTTGTLPGEISAGGQDAFVRRYDAAGIELWTHQFGTPGFGAAGSDAANGITVDATGVYVAATVNTDPSNPDTTGQALVRKYELDGDELWTRQFVGSAGDAGAHAAAVGTTGVYVAGFVPGLLPGQTGFGGFDSFVRKYDPNGTEVWTRQFGYRGNDAARAVDGDGNVYVVGVVGGYLPELPGIDRATGPAFLRKYDATGNHLWTRQFGASNPVAGQIFPPYTVATAIAVDASGVYVAGLEFREFPFDEHDAFVRKFDADGNLQWTQQFGTPGNDLIDGIAIDATGIYVAGFTDGALPGESSAGGRDAFVRKHELPTGNIIWTDQFGSPSLDQATGVAVDASGVYVAGFSDGALPGQTNAGGRDAFVRKYDTAAGGVLWTQQFGTASTDEATGVAADVGGLYVSGFTGGAFAGQTSAGDNDAFLRRIDSGDGAEMWTRQFGTPGADQANGVAIGPTGVYVTGFVAGALPGETSAGGQDAFVRKYAFSGTPMWTGQFGTDAADSAAAIDVGTAGLFVAGATTGAFPGQTSNGGQDAFVARIVDGVGSSEADVSGRVFDDKDNDGLYEPEDGDAGIGGVAVQLFDEVTGALLAIQTTAADGTYFFDVNLSAGTYKLVADQPAGFLDGRESGGNLGGAVDNTQDSNQIAAIDISGATAAIDYLFAEIRPSQALGLAWSDANNDGEVNFGETVIPGVAIELTGLDERGRAVSRTAVTDASGVYAFLDLRPSDATGYTIREIQPAGYTDGLDLLGTVNGAPVGNNSINDTFTGVGLPRPDSLAENYNFGERPLADGGVTPGQTATIGYWQNNNGQRLIHSLNGGSTSTQLSDWLAARFPNMYGVHAGANNLAGKTNTEVAAFYKSLFARTARTAAGGGPPKLDAQVMATALAVYVTNQSLAGTTAAAYGFLVTENGVGTRTFNVGGSGAAFGVADDTEVTVLDLLLELDSRSKNGLLFDLDGDGDASDSLETSYRTMANDVFSGINETGGI